MTDDANANLAAVTAAADAVLTDLKADAAAIDAYLDAESGDYDVEEKADAAALATYDTAIADAESAAAQSLEQNDPSPWAAQYAAVASANATQAAAQASAEQTAEDTFADDQKTSEIAANDAQLALADAQAQAWHDQVIALAQASNNLTLSASNTASQLAAADAYFAAVGGQRVGGILLPLPSGEGGGEGGAVLPLPSGEGGGEGGGIPMPLSPPGPGAPGITLTGDYGYAHPIGVYNVGDTVDLIDGVVQQMFKVSPDGEPSIGPQDIMSYSWLGAGGDMPYGPIANRIPTALNSIAPGGPQPEWSATSNPFGPEVLQDPGQVAKNPPGGSSNNQPQSGVASNQPRSGKGTGDRLGQNKVGSRGGALPAEVPGPQAETNIGDWIKLSFMWPYYLTMSQLQRARQIAPTLPSAQAGAPAQRDRGNGGAVGVGVGAAAVGAAVALGSDRLTDADKKIAQATKEAAAEMKAQGWTYDPAEDGGGAFGDEVHKRVSAKLNGQDGWYVDVYVEKGTNKVLSVGGPPEGVKSTNYNQVDAIRANAGVKIEVGTILGPENVEEVYDVKTAANGRLMDGQQEGSLKRIKYGANLTDDELAAKRIKTVTPPERFTPAKGWHAHPRFGETGLKLLQILGPIAAIHLLLTSDANAADFRRVANAYAQVKDDPAQRALWLLSDMKPFLERFISDAGTVNTILLAINAASEKR